MNITVFGSGYVGLVTGACLADVGNQVMCMDVDQSKIDRLKQGIIPIYEPGLEEMIKDNMAAGRLHFTTDVKEAVDFGLFQFIAVGTPPDEDGSGFALCIGRREKRGRAHERLQNHRRQIHRTGRHGRQS